MTERRITAQLLIELGLKTAASLVAARAVRTPDARWWEACRGCGLRDDEAPDRWIEPFVSATRDDNVYYESEPDRRACGRGWALDYIEECAVIRAPEVKRRAKTRRRHVR